MGRFFKHLRIDELTLLFVITDDDPYKAALNYGYVSGTMAPLVTLINQSFKIKKWDVRAFPSFTECEETVYIKAKATIALWEIVYIIAKLDFKAIFSIF